MDTLIHDPRTKKQIKEALYTYLYGTVLKAFKTRLDTIIIKNALLSGSSHQSFIYKGVFYTCDVFPMPRKSNRLITQMVPLMEVYLSDIKQLNGHEIPYVLGYINQVLNSSNELHDYLKALPDAVHSPISDLISTCSCRGTSLSLTALTQLKTTNVEAINLLKQRLVYNLIT